MKSTLVFCLMLLAGCRGSHQQKSIVLLIDISASVDADASQMENAATGVADHLERGDKITVFPICDTAYTSKATPLQYSIPKKREAFNEETTQFRRRFRGFLKELTGNAKCSKTAILDAMTRASSERGSMYILTDGIEDSSVADFYVDRRMRSKEAARQLAVAIAKDKAKIGFVRLGLVGSKGFDALAPQRQEAVVSFWKEYLSVISTDFRVESASLEVEP